MDEQESGDPVVKQEWQEGPVPPAPAGLGECEEDPESERE